MYAKEPAVQWEPVLSGEDTREAENAVRAIAGEISDLAFLPTGKRIHRPPLSRLSPSLGYGNCGVAVLHGYLAQAGSDDSSGSMALEVLAMCRRALTRGEPVLGLHSGLAGFAWTLEHLATIGSPAFSDDLNSETDQLFLRWLAQIDDTCEFDLMSGLVGVGVYALERLPRPSAVDCLAQVVRLLIRKAQKTSLGFHWQLPVLTLGTQYENYSHGLGVAHGSAGVLALLSLAYSAGLNDNVLETIEGAVHWILSHKTAVPGQTKPELISWCWGDLGIAAALLLAGRCTGRFDWERFAIDIARCCAHLPPTEVPVADSCLCHGAAGFAHILNRLYNASGDRDLGEAARRWFRQVLDSRCSSGGTAGFLFQIANDNGRIRLGRRLGLLSGVTGVALALLSASAPVRPDWDRSLLVSLPPRLPDGHNA